jgi:soluble lytic murein transglycosylase
MELAGSRPATHERIQTIKRVAPDYLSIGLEDAPVRFWQLLFPLPYRQVLMNQAKHRALDPYIVAGLIRQESEFNPRAVSRARAYGLTQLLPSTGRSMARKNGIRRFRTTMLFQPETNLLLGISYLHGLLTQWSGRWEHALASYNAGKSRVDEWLTWGDYREPAEFVETIPFTETREYVQAVLRNAALYRQLYGPKGAALADQAAPAKPPAAAKSAPVKKSVKASKKSRASRKTTPPRKRRR